MKKCIVVMGMHRSGTSAFSGVLHILGIDLGSDYLNPSEDNPKGFFENYNVSQFNEKILNSLNSSWDDVFLLSENWWEEPDLHIYEKEAAEIIKKEFSQAVPFGIKDPRLCILLPFWTKMFKELNIKPHYIISIRNPLEVAESLKKRNDFTFEKSALLWMKYMINVELYSRNSPRVFVSFDELLSDPQETINKISNILNIEFPKNYQDVKDDIEQLLEPGLKHYTFKANNVDKYSPEFLSDYYYLLLHLTCKEKFSDYEISKIDTIRENFLKIYRLFYHKETENRRQLNQLVSEWNQITAERDMLLNTIDAIYQSNFWKVVSSWYRVRDTIPIFRYVYKSLEIIKNEGFGALLNKLGSKVRGGVAILRGTIKSILPVDMASSPSAVNTNKYDVIFFPIISWDFRYQRPQQIASRFAGSGHRVFYLSVNLRKQDSYVKRYIKRQVLENVYEITLPFTYKTTIYNADIREGLGILTTSLETLFKDFEIKESIAIVEFPLWHPIVEYLKKEYGTKVIFDCLDEFVGFENVKADIAREEELLLENSDFCITTSAKLYSKFRDKCKDIAIIRNATEFEHFNKLPPNNILKGVKKPIIGYYGAISEWFDIETVVHIAVQRPEWSIVLIGHTFGSHIYRLKKYKNIHLLGEKPYAELPKFLYWFDVCIIPFKLNELTLSTNPVKFYEFISSGKPVVSSRFPELLPYSDVLYLSQSKEEFLRNITIALEENDQNLINRRIELARTNDWNSRLYEIKNCIKHTHPLVTIVIVTFNNLEYTKLCIESIYAKTAYPNLELVIVDNASSDGTPDYLNALKGEYDNIKIILNKQNLGFAAANNIGVKESRGEYIILLNNDTVVTRGWISGLIKYLENPEIGMVGPVTNSIGNEAKINVEYRYLSRMDMFSERYTAKNKGKFFEITVLALFCAAISRQTVEKVGLLDEQFSIGLFEDDDYALRIKKAGLKLICAEDVFIHHFGRASFGKLQTTEYQRIFNENKRKYEQKWDIKWIPHRYREGGKMNYGNGTFFKRS